MKTVTTPVAAIDNAAPRDYATELALSIQNVILTVKDKIATERPPIKGIRPYAQELMVAGVEKLPLNNPLLTRFFANSVKRMCDVNNATLGNIETASGYDAALSSFLTSIDWFSRGWDSEGQYEKSIKATTAPKSKTTAATIDYTPLITELQALHDSPDYTAEQAEDIAFLISSLTITATNTATDAKTFYTVLTTDKDFESLQVYVKCAVAAATEKAKAKAEEDAKAAQTAEQVAKARILARLKR